MKRLSPMIAHNRVLSPLSWPLMDEYYEGSVIVLHTIKPNHPELLIPQFRSSDPSNHFPRGS
jgi:hypothetical protein